MARSLIVATTPRPTNAGHRPGEWRSMFGSLGRVKLATVGVSILLAVAFAALGAPILAPYPPNDIDVLRRLQPPVWQGDGSSEHLLGTDQLGRDVLTRLIYGGRISLLVGSVTTACAALIGVLLGLIGGYYGGVFDEIFMRLADILLAFPFVLLAMMAVALLGPSLVNVIIVLSIFGWVGYARMVRGEMLVLREKEFVEAARVLGANDVRIMLRHILPNVLAPVIVIASFVAAAVITAEAALSFLGLGIPPAIPSWGAMLADGRDNLNSAWWLATFPGLAIVLTVLALNLVGDWLRDYLDPRLRV
jgi:peptide/nickel transport system permease protein